MEGQFRIKSTRIIKRYMESTNVKVIVSEMIDELKENLRKEFRSQECVLNHYDNWDDFYAQKLLPLFSISFVIH